MDISTVSWIIFLVIWAAYIIFMAIMEIRARRRNVKLLLAQWEAIAALTDAVRGLEWREAMRDQQAETARLGAPPVSWPHEDGTAAI